MGPVNQSGRRLPALLAAGLLILFSACEAPPEPTLAPALWQDFETRFIRSGRVIDTGNGGISHSEGQGFGMLFAVAAGDRNGFTDLWHWTARVLQRDDGLLRWRYAPCPSRDARCITDDNNASDGDLLVAWALLRAHEAWGDTAHREAAQRIIAAIERQLVVKHAGYTLLLPGAAGFRHGDDVTVNLSYWVFPALEAFLQHSDGPWQALIESGLSLIDAARFGEAQLPPDWLQVGADLRPSPRFPTRYGFDAVRIPLYMTWAGLAPDDNWRAFRGFWQRDPVPAWVDLSDDSSAEFAWSRGMARIADLVGSGPDLVGSGPDADGVGSEERQGPSGPSIEDTHNDYYSQALLLLSHIAATERPS
ncbi:MAG: glycosyl hydrolase family 8 [Halioglobus sp.]|nr:glycosyl hydrolase family 8 [Halioglobus sp.]